jgi:hypothetical protein
MLKQSFLLGIRALVLCSVLIPAINIAQADPAPAPAPTPAPYDPYANFFNQITGLMATQNQELTTAITGLSSSIDNLLNGYGTTMQKYIGLMSSYDLGNLQAGGAAQEQLAQIPFKQAQPLTLQGIVNTLTTVDSDAIAKNTVQNIPAPLQPIPAGATSTSKANLLASAEQNSTSFDMNSLLTPLQYDTQGQQNALNFITLVSGQGNPLSVIDFSNVPNPQSALNNSKIANYLATLRTYTAQQATGLSTLYHQYAERLPSTDLGALANELPPPNPATTLSGLPANPSALQIREYLATRRVRDNNWYTSMSVASPIEVQRQTLYLLAEMRAEMFHQDMEMERLNTSLAVLVLQNAMNQRMVLSTAKPEVQKTIERLQGVTATQTNAPANLNPIPKNQLPQQPSSGTPPQNSPSSGTSSSNNNSTTPSQ